MNRCRPLPFTVALFAFAACGDGGTPEGSGYQSSAFAPCRGAKPLPAPSGEFGALWNVEPRGFDKLLFADEQGHSNESFESVPGVTVYITGDNAMEVLFPDDRNFSLRMRAAEPAGALTITRQTLVPLSVTRYNDIPLQAGEWLSLALCVSGPQTLRGGERTILPTAVVTGAAAADQAGPETNVSATANLVTITANDPSGIAQILYSFDMRHYSRYVAPFDIPCGQDVVITVIADDKIGNRSSPPSTTVRC